MNKRRKYYCYKLMVCGFIIGSFMSGLNGQAVKSELEPASPESKTNGDISSETPLIKKPAKIESQFLWKPDEDNLSAHPLEKERILPMKTERHSTGIRIALSDNSLEEFHLPEKDASQTKLGPYESGWFIRRDENNYAIPNQSVKDYYFPYSESIPDNAYITDVQYEIRIDDNGDETDFYPYDYEIWISSASHSDVEWYYECVYDNVGTISSHTDDGNDDDAADDTDIYLDYRSTDAFNGETPAQFFTVRILDNYGVTSGNGIIDYVVLKIFWETQKPNLNVSYTPSGWESPLVINHTIGSKSSASTLYANVPAYINLSYVNRDAEITDNFYFDFFKSGSVETRWDRPGASEDTYYTFENREYTFTAGATTICQVVDYTDAINESNEGDNSYCRSVTFVGPPNPPSLIFPSNSATCQASDITFDWSTTDHTATYHIQVDNNADFSSPAFEQTAVLSSQMVFFGLNSNTTYHWRVRGSNPAGTGAWSSSYSFTTAASVPGVPDLESPNDGASCQSTELTLNWNSVSGASGYKLQVDNNHDFSSPETNLSGLGLTEQEISGLLAGYSYVWRVAAENSCGAASAWSEIRDFTTSGIPSAPGLTNPSDGSTCQPTTLTLDWESVSGASNYQVQVGNADFSSVAIEFDDINSTAVEISGLDPNTTYHWRVSTENDCGAYSSWSASRSFTTISYPSAPLGSSPEDGASCQALSLSLEWDAGSGASEYELQLDDNDDFSSPILNEIVGGLTSYSVSGLAEGTDFYWRVKSINACSAESAWSGTRNFTTLISSLSAPDLASPNDAAECQATSPTLSWNSVAHAAGYILEVDNDADFSSVEYSRDCAGITHNCSELSENAEYYWRVAATGDCEVSSEWSIVRSFETGSDGMATPVLSSPEDNSEDAETSVTLSWEEVSDATGYQIQLDDNNDFSSLLVNEETSETSITITDLAEETTYYWQVRAMGSCATGNWSDIWQFDTESIAVPNAISSNKYSDYYLGHNYPDPFMETTTIEFNIPVDGQVHLEFLDMQGKLVESISNFYPAGKHSVQVDLPGKVKSGIYIYRMKALGFIDSKLCVVR